MVKIAIWGGKLKCQLNIQIHKLAKMVEEDDIKVFPSMKEYFIWVHEDSEKRELIEEMWKIRNGESAGIDEEQVFELEDGTIVFVYN